MKNLFNLTQHHNLSHKIQLHHISGYGGEGDDEDEDSEDEEKYAMLRADIEDRQEGGFRERNRKVGPNDAEVRNLLPHRF